MATYIGVALYICAYGGHTVWSKFVRKETQHFVPLLKVDLDTDAVWKAGEGKVVRDREAVEKRLRDEAEAGQPGFKGWWHKATKRISIY